LTPLEVRRATPADAEALSRVHADTWVDTYVGQVPDELVRDRVPRIRDRNWVEHVELRTFLGGGVLALLDDEDVVGFCEFGPTEDADDDAQQVGHIMRLYVHPRHQGRGGGRLLLESACHQLALDGFVEATLWTLDAASNRARAFYAHLGWMLEGTLNAGVPPDVRYRRPLTKPLTSATGDSEWSRSSSSGG